MTGRFTHHLGFRRLATGVAASAALAPAACGGGGEDYANNPRPPAPINIAASISEERVSVSPRSLGAGPVILIIANQTGESQQLTLETDDAGTATTPGITRSTGPINPGGTAQLKVDMAQGTYVVQVEDDGIRPATLEVGRERPSAQNELMQP